MNFGRKTIIAALMTGSMTLGALVGAAAFTGAGSTANAATNTGQVGNVRGARNEQYAGHHALGSHAVCSMRWPFSGEVLCLPAITPWDAMGTEWSSSSTTGRS